MPICATTLWYTQSWVSFCTNSMHLASLHKCNRPLQYHPLGPPCLSSPLAILHVPIPQEDSDWWLDVTGWNPSMCNRYRYAILLLPAVWLRPYLNCKVRRLTLSFFLVDTFRLWSYVCRSWTLLTIVNSGIGWIYCNLQEHDARFVYSLQCLFLIPG